MGHQMLLTEFYPDKMGYTSACTTNIAKILASDGGAG